mmetsp:Transcript_5311/g.11140  ORF Transcript_5311/g.11140 Transcript_5311/m.11140 type:complete len:363 (+) Transcript_5311:160-1248(+)
MTSIGAAAVLVSVLLATSSHGVVSLSNSNSNNNNNNNNAGPFLVCSKVSRNAAAAAPRAGVGGARRGYRCLRRPCRGTQHRLRSVGALAAGGLETRGRRGREDPRRVLPGAETKAPGSRCGVVCRRRHGREDRRGGSAHRERRIVQKVRGPRRGTIARNGLAGRRRVGPGRPVDEASRREGEQNRIRREDHYQGAGSEQQPQRHERGAVRPDNTARDRPFRVPAERERCGDTGGIYRRDPGIEFRGASQRRHHPARPGDRHGFAPRIEAPAVAGRPTDGGTQSPRGPLGGMVRKPREKEQRRRTRRSTPEVCLGWRLSRRRQEIRVEARSLDEAPKPAGTTRGRIRRRGQHPGPGRHPGRYL